MSSLTNTVLLELEEEEEEDVITDLASNLNSVVISRRQGNLIRNPNNVSRAALKEAIKLGRRDKTRPGPSGETRHKFIHRGMVYITDAAERQVISSWRIDGKDENPFDAPMADPASRKIHAVFVVDDSGSMRRDDVPGFSSRTEAVFKTLLKQFLQPQMELTRQDPTASMNVSVSLILAAQEASVVLQRAPLDHSLEVGLEELSSHTAMYHGFYLTGLAALEKLLDEEKTSNSRIMVFWLSDGAPSDHVHTPCTHGTRVWDSGYSNQLPECPYGNAKYLCRPQVKRSVREKCLRQIRHLGDTFGQHRLSFTTVGFGPAKEDFHMLQDMAAVLPLGKFHKLGLNVHHLASVFTTLTSTMTTLRTRLAGGGTTPNARKNKAAQRIQNLDDSAVDSSVWDVYIGPDLVRKYTYSHAARAMMDVPMEEGANGIAMRKEYFEAGAERFAFECTEVASRGAKHPAQARGYALVAKESATEEYLNIKFYERAAKTQAFAQSMAERFNERVRTTVGSLETALRVSFAPCTIYEVKDPYYDNGIAWILAEPSLEGKFVKWNSNSGEVKKHMHETVELPQGTTCDVDDVPQAFSHFSYEVTGKEELICDLQGVWNAYDGFTLTDPAIHHISESKRHGKSRTDRGTEGIRQFMETHTCSPLCRALGLSSMVAAPDSGHGDWQEILDRRSGY